MREQGAGSHTKSQKGTHIRPLAGVLLVLLVVFAGTAICSAGLIPPAPPAPPPAPPAVPAAPVAVPTPAQAASLPAAPTPTAAYVPPSSEPPAPSVIPVSDIPAPSAPDSLPTLPSLNPTANPTESPPSSSGDSSGDSGSSDYSPPDSLESVKDSGPINALEMPPAPEVAPPEEAAPPSDLESKSASSQGGATSSQASSSDSSSDYNPDVPPVPTPAPVIDTLRSTARNATAVTPAAMIVPEEATPVVAITTGFSLALLGNLFWSNIDKVFSFKLLGFVRDYIGEQSLQGLDEYEAKRRKITVAKVDKTYFGFSPMEIAVAIGGAILIGLASILALRDPFSVQTIVIYIVAGGIAVTFHELGHRFAAKRKNVATEMKFWELGAATMFLTGWFAGNVFAQPQRTLIDEKGLEEHAHDEGKIPVEVQISLAGPLVNLAMALIIVPFLFVGGVVTQVASIMLMVTLLIAVYHLMPFSPMDGKAIYKWNKWALVLMLLPLIAIYYYLFLV